MERRMYKAAGGPRLAAHSTPLFNATCIKCALEMVLCGYGEDAPV